LSIQPNGGVAQSGERVLCKHEVVGSIPSASTSFSKLEEQVEEQVLRRKDQAKTANLMKTKMSG
jgi:hypothetical protein